MHQPSLVFRTLRLLLGATILLAAPMACAKAWGLLVQAYDDQSFYSLISGLSFIAFGCLTAFIAWLAAFGSRSPADSSSGPS